MDYLEVQLQPLDSIPLKPKIDHLVLIPQQRVQVGLEPVYLVPAILQVAEIYLHQILVRLKILSIRQQYSANEIYIHNHRMLLSTLYQSLIILV